MRRTEWQEETRLMRFEETYLGWQKRRFTQEEAAQILGVSDRSFRRYIDRYRASGLESLVDCRLMEDSHKKAPVDEVFRLEGLYKETYGGWNVKHFYGRYREEHGGQRSYTWVKNRLQDRGLVKKGRRKGAHRKRRERAPIPGMLIHQDGSTHEWVSGKKWDLIITMDDATSEIYSGFFVEEEGTSSSFCGVNETMAAQGVFSSFYSDRGSHYWHTPEAGTGHQWDKCAKVREGGDANSKYLRHSEKQCLPEIHPGLGKEVEGLSGSRSEGPRHHRHLHGWQELC